MEEIGKVIGISGKLAKVEIEPKGACSHCASRIFCNPAGNKMLVESINEQRAEIGDMVKVETGPGITILAAFLIFILPIISFGIGFSIVGLLIKTQTCFGVQKLAFAPYLAIFGGIGFMIVYFLFLKRLNNKVSKTRKFKPIVKEILREFIKE